MENQQELQARLNREGREINKAVEAEIGKVEDKLNKENSAWMKSGGDGVIGAGNDSKGTKSFNAETHRTAKKLGAK
jgi:hypothetical protein